MKHLINTYKQDKVRYVQNWMMTNVSYWSAFTTPILYEVRNYSSIDAERSYNKISSFAYIFSPISQNDIKSIYKQMLT